MSQAFIPLELEDSQFAEGQPLSGAGLAAKVWALEEFGRAKLTPVSLRGRALRPVSGLDLIACRPHWRAPGELVSALAFTSHYVGSFTASPTGGSAPVRVSVRARYGRNASVFRRLVSHAYGVYLPDFSAARAWVKRDKEPDLLLALLWQGALEKALTDAHIPRNYITEERNTPFFRGRLLVGKHVRSNLTDASRFYCRRRELTTDITINRAIRRCYAILREDGLGGVLHRLADYDARLASFGVRDVAVTPADLDRIRYTRLNAPYRPLMQLCRVLLQRQQSTPDAARPGGNAFFLDMAELWEAYLLAVLRTHLPGYVVYSANDTGGDWLIAGHRRRIKPDILISDGEKLVAVLDAKYKRVQRVGHVEDAVSVSREDLHQMGAYLYHYGRAGAPLVGLFATPCAGDDDVHPLVGHPEHRLGIMHLDLEQFDALPDARGIQKVEADFAARVLSQLGGASARP